MQRVVAIVVAVVGATKSMATELASTKFTPSSAGPLAQLTLVIIDFHGYKLATRQPLLRCKRLDWRCSGDAKRSNRTEVAGAQ